MHTAQHIVQSCLCGNLAKGRTIILVTHHVSLCLPVASYVVELSRGTVVRQGTVLALRMSGQLEQVLTDEDAPSNLEETEANASSDPDSDDLLRDVIRSGKLVEAEARAEGRVSLDTYLTYAKAAGLSLWILTFLLILIMALVNITTDVSTISSDEIHYFNQK